GGRPAARPAPLPGVAADRRRDPGLPPRRGLVPGLRAAPAARRRPRLPGVCAATAEPVRLRRTHTRPVARARFFRSLRLESPWPLITPTPLKSFPASIRCASAQRSEEHTSEL